MKVASKKVRTTLKSPSGKVVFKKKVAGKVQAVNNSGSPIKVDATKCQLKKAGLPQRVQSSHKKQGYKARGHESVSMKNKGKKNQGYKARLNEREGMRNYFGDLLKRIK